VATTRDLWHKAGRAARADRMRLLALQGLLWSGPLLVLGSFVSRIPDVDPGGILRPVGYVLDPLLNAWRTDQDLALLGYLGLQLLLLALLWGLFGGAIYRLAAVDLTQGRRERGLEGLAFARRHWRGFVGARVALWLGVVAPLLAAALLALPGRLPGWIGGLALAVAVGAAILLALAAVVVASVTAVAGFLTGPTVAVEDSDAFDAVGRTFTYAASGLPRLVGLRLLFLGGVVLGSAWRLLRLAGAAVLAYLALRAGAGTEGIDRALAILGASGAPADAARLGIADHDYVVAAVIALGVGSLAILWLADLVSRVCCARTAVYLLLRRDVDRVPPTTLRTAPHHPGHQGPREAGFVEMGRIGDE
jgi:hypothetical protein